MTVLERKPEVRVVIGAQWGDEGKGKIVDLLAQKADVVMRVQGSNNAGHTVINEFGESHLHLIPSGIFNPKTKNIIGTGVVVNPWALIKEISEIEAKGVDTSNLILSERATLLLPYHAYLDEALEKAKGKNQVGTTGKGNGIAYSDRAERGALTLSYLKDSEKCLTKLEENFGVKRKFLACLGNGSAPKEFSLEFYKEQIPQFSAKLSHMITNTEEIVYQYLSNGSTILIEGAQGFLLDPFFGTYPKSTSSPTTAAGLIYCAGIPLSLPVDVIGVFKAFQTRVGAGPMPTEMGEEQTQELRDAGGGEYGTTTGRPRRIGRFDAAAAAYAMRRNGFSKIAITKLDTLSGMGDLKICRAYKWRGRTLTEFPADEAVLAECEPIYEKADCYKGWNEDIRKIRRFKDLPIEAQRYVLGIYESIASAALPGREPELSYIGVGQGRHEFISCSKSSLFA